MKILNQMGLQRGMLEGRTALVTGSARGIGEQVARQLAWLGAKVIIADILDEGAEVERTIVEGGGKARYIGVDLASPDEVERLLESAGEIYGPVEILVNNAVRACDVEPLIRTHLEQWDFTYNISIRATVTAIQRLLPAMLERRYGVIASTISMEGMAYASAYSVAKVGLRSLTHSLAAEIGPDAGVSVFAFSPGLVETSLVMDHLAPGLLRQYKISLGELMARFPANPGYEGLMPPEHCAAGYVHSIVHAQEYHGQIAAPFNALHRAGIIDLDGDAAETEASGETVPEEKDAPPPGHSGQLSTYVKEVVEINKNLELRIERRTEELEEARAKSEELLLNILPEAIAERLKSAPGTIADAIRNSTILFADIVDFTVFSESITPVGLVEVLNRIFSLFDHLAERYDLEKIKTVGDEYMVASGIPSPRDDHAESIARMSLDMRDALQQFNLENGYDFEMRMGFHSGPVVAGVIGLKKFAYDIWGDAVNTASRMESHGIPGQIQVSEPTHDLLKDKFFLRERGLIDVKGKGQMKTFLLHGIR